jgi:hypothetical protein
VADQGAAYDLLAATSEVYFTPAPTGRILVRSGIHVEPVLQEGESSAANSIWNGTVTYQKWADAAITFDTTGGTQHITQSIATKGSYAPEGKTAANHLGAIGVTKDSVEGVDITVPAYAWSETYSILAVNVTAAYRATIAALTGAVNDNTFRTLAAGSVLFLGASGSVRGGENWEITYRFASIPNQTGLTVGGVTGIAKLGWDYLWVQYEDYSDDTAHDLGKKVKAVYVEQVYRAGSFSTLGIGTA